MSQRLFSFLGLAFSQVVGDFYFEGQMCRRLLFLHTVSGCTAVCVDAFVVFAVTELLKLWRV